MDTVIIGANGMIGNSLMHYLDAVGTFHNCKDNLIEGKRYEFLDISDKQKVFEFFELHRPKRVFLTAYNAWVDGCEIPSSDKVNIFGVSNVISASTVHDSCLIFFSSSYVFNGESQVPYKTKDETFPINRYGRQKEKMENEIRNREGLQWLIIRTVGVFGHEGSPKNFVAQIRRAVKEKRKVYVPLDQTSNPIWSMDLARVAVRLSDRYSCEVFHVSGDKCLSKYEFAIKIAYSLGCKKPHDLIVGLKSEEMKSNNPNVPVANRPKNGCLDCGALTARAISIPQFERGLKKFIEEEYKEYKRKSD